MDYGTREFPHPFLSKYFYGIVNVHVSDALALLGMSFSITWTATSS